LRLTPRHCIILAFIWIFPTMLVGIMDWQHFYGGAWLFPIRVKLTVAPILAGLLLAAILLARKYGVTSGKVLPIYFLCFFCVVVLGYFGGQLVYGGRTTRSPEQFKEGGKMFAADCGACHPHGGNAIDPSKPVLHSSKLKDLDTFLAWVRHPETPMPAFPASKISDAQGKELYAYIRNVLEHPKKEETLK
jgi:cytochrome c553